MLDRTAEDRRHELWEDGSLIVRAGQVPWTPWALPGTAFKLLDYDRNRSYYVMLLRIDRDAPSVIHKHIGAANAFILQGGFSYDHGAKREGDFFVEAGGVEHMPKVDEDGCLLLGFSHGCVAGYDEEGRIAGVIDVDWMIDAAEGGAFAHLEGVRRS